MFVTAQLSLAVTTFATRRSSDLANTFTTRLVDQVITGDCTSFTVTVKLHVALLPCASVAVLVTVVAPPALLPSPTRRSSDLTPGQLSVAVTTKVTLLEHVPPNALTTRLLEQ